MNVYVRELSTSLAQAGVEVKVYVRRDDDALAERVAVEPGLEVIHVPAGPVGASKEQLPALIQEFADGVRADQLEDPSAVLHANYWLSAEAGRLIKGTLGVPLVATFHTLARVKAQHGERESPTRELSELDVVGCCDAICVSNVVEAAQLEQLYQAERSRIEIVPPGVDHAFFSPGDRAGARAALGLDDGPTMLFVGRIQPLKGLDLAIAALAELPDTVRLVVVGGPSGPDGFVEVQKVTTMVERLELTERVVFVPPQPHHLLSTYYRAADLVIVPSRSESFGLVALEAAACGIPVVAAEVGGLRCLVDDTRTGFLIGSRDPIDYAKRVEQILFDPDLAARMGRSAAELGRGYSWPSAAERLLGVYDEVASRSLVSCS